MKNIAIEKQLKDLKESVTNKIEKDFDFDVEHWDNGNYDDSYNYGVECGIQFAYREILDKLTKIKT